MLYGSVDSFSYIADFRKRFTNFAEKAPCLLSFSTDAQKVTIVDEAQGTVFEFPFDYTVPVKSFIFGIKNILIDRGIYPHIIKVDTTKVRVSEEEAVNRIVDGEDLSEVPNYNTIETKTEYLIEKCIIFKDIFIIRDIATQKLYRYKMNRSSVFFLTDLRKNKFTKETAGSYFFQNSTLLNEIVPKDEVEKE